MTIPVKLSSPHMVAEEAAAALLVPRAVQEEAAEGLALLVFLVQGMMLLGLVVAQLLKVRLLEIA